jgi:hypothetical protein
LDLNCQAREYVEGKGGGGEWMNNEIGRKGKTKMDKN